MVALLIELEELPTAAELRQHGVTQMQVTFDPSDAYPPLTTLTLHFSGPDAVDNAQRFVEARDTVLDEFVLTAGFG
jgi:hypothetical protein